MWLFTFRESLKYGFHPLRELEKWWGRVDMVIIIILGIMAGIGYFVDNLRWLLTILTPSLIALLFFIATMRLMHPVAVVKRIRQSKRGYCSLKVDSYEK